MRIGDDVYELFGTADKAPSNGLSFATVTQTAPLLIRLGGDSDPLPFTPASLAGASELPVGSRVVVARMGGEVIVLGALSPKPVRYALSLVGASASTAAHVDEHGGRAYLLLAFTVGATALSNGHVLEVLPAHLAPKEYTLFTGATSAGLAVRAQVYPNGSVVVGNPTIPAGSIVTFAASWTPATSWSV